jgi:hypothetical protein
MENTSQRRRDILASNLLFASLVLSLSASIIQPYLPHQPPRIYTLGSITAVATVYLLRGMLYYAVRLGKPWAKKLLLAMFLFNIVAAIVVFTNPLMQQLASRPSELVPVLIVQSLLALALVLLFKKPTLRVV